MKTINRWLIAACDPVQSNAPEFGGFPESRLSPLLALAQQHAVLGATLQSLASWKIIPQNSGDHSLSLAVIEQYRLSQFKNMGVLLGLQQIAAQTLQALGAEGIPCCILKGEDFANRLYPNLSLRPFRDVDLLVPKADFAKADRTLRALGFEADLPIRKYDAMDYGQISYYSCGAEKWSVELHWNLINSPSQRLNCSLSWEALDFLETPGAYGQRLLSPTSLFVLATVHACVGHRFDSLQQLCDIRQLVRGAAGPIAVDRLVRMCEQFSCATSVHWSLELLIRVFDCPQARELINRCNLSRRATKRHGILDTQTVLRPEAWSSRLRRSLARKRLASAA